MYENMHSYTTDSMAPYYLSLRMQVSGCTGENAA